MKVRFLILCLLNVWLPLTLTGAEGILIYKANLWQKEEFARTMPYKALEKFPTVHNVTDRNGERTRVSSDLVLKDFPFPSPKDLANLRDEKQVNALEALVAEWQASLRHFPSSVKYLKPQIAALQGEIAHFRAGEVKADGEWMTRAKLEEMKRQLAREREQLMARLAREAKEMAVNAAEWQAMDDEGRQKARDARQAVMVAQIAADEQRRVEAEIQRQAAIAAARAQLPPFERIATDETILPPKLSVEQAAEYRKTLEELNTGLKPIHHEIAFKKEVQKFAIRTPKLIHVVSPKELSHEVRVIRPEEGIEDPPIIEVTTQNRREVILTYSKEDAEPRRSAMIVLPATSEMDLDALRNLLSKLITIASSQEQNRAAGGSSENGKSAAAGAQGEKTPVKHPVAIP